MLGGNVRLSPLLDSNILRIYFIKPTIVKPKDMAIDGPRRLGGSAGGQDAVAGLSAEMRAKVERERRARATEARLKTLNGAC